MDKFDLNDYKVDQNEFKTANVNGHIISYNESINREKKHVLFIHGIGASLFGWRDIPDALSEQFHTISLDLIGFGGSDKPENADYTIKGLSKFIMDFLATINLEDEKLTLIGHSLGGYIALQVAIDNKDMIEKIVLIDPSGKLTEPTSLLKDYLRAATEPLTDRYSPLRYDKLKHVFEQMYFLSSNLNPIVLGSFLDTIERPGGMEAFISTFQDSTTKQLESGDLKRIENVPCLILWGANDALIDPKEYAKKFLNDLPNACLEIIPNSGHAPFVEKTATVYERIRRFLA